MNGNLPHAAGVIKAVLESVRSEQATVAAYALDRARLLVDPERSFGTVLHRTPQGRWTRVPQPVTDLEHQALAWDASCARAREVARVVERHLADHAGPYGIRVDGDRVRIVLRVSDHAQWAHWRAYFGFTTVQRTRAHAVTAEGQREGVPVTVVAHSPVPAAPPTQPAAPARPFRLGAITYDLALPLRDIHGDIWYFHGCRNREGMPLLSIDGRPERCSLANVAEHLGPLSPVRPSTPVRLPDAGPGSSDTDAPAPSPSGPPPTPAGSPAGPAR
ncbi:BN159_2729 family protein [Streptomyces sp. NPDC054842]